MLVVASFDAAARGDCCLAATGIVLLACAKLCRCPVTMRKDLTALCLGLQMSKTEKTMAEMEIDQNVKFEWDRITEAGAELQPLSGPG